MVYPISVLYQPRLVGTLYRHFYPWSSPEALHKLYIALIRPRLEYAAPVWSLHHSKDINKLEAVQKFTLRMCSKDWGANYSHLLSQYQLPNVDALEPEPFIKNNCVGMLYISKCSSLQVLKCILHTFIGSQASGSAVCLH